LKKISCRPLFLSLKNQNQKSESKIIKEVVLKLIWNYGENDEERQDIYENHTLDLLIDNCENDDYSETIRGVLWGFLEYGIVQIKSAPHIRKIYFNALKISNRVEKDDKPLTCVGGIHLIVSNETGIGAEVLISDLEFLDLILEFKKYEDVMVRYFIAHILANLILRKEKID